jgi:hypothetical protein
MLRDDEKMKINTHKNMKYKREEQREVKRNFFLLDLRRLRVIRTGWEVTDSEILKNPES